MCVFAATGTCGLVTHVLFVCGSKTGSASELFPSWNPHTPTQKQSRPPAFSSLSHCVPARSGCRAQLDRDPGERRKYLRPRHQLAIAGAAALPWQQGFLLLWKREKRVTGRWHKGNNCWAGIQGHEICYSFLSAVHGCVVWNLLSLRTMSSCTVHCVRNSTFYIFVPRVTCRIITIKYYYFIIIFIIRSVCWVKKKMFAGVPFFSLNILWTFEFGIIERFYK